MFNVNADYFRAATVCQSTEETRYYLRGVHIEPHPVKGVVLVATDGSRMIVVHDESGTCDAPVIVRLEKAVLKETKRGKGDKDARRVAMDETGEVWVKAGDDKLVFVKEPVIDGSFPDWRRVLPGLGGPGVGAELQWFDPDFLADFGTAATALECEGWTRQTPQQVRIEPGQCGGPALVRLGASANAFGVLMPVKGVHFERGLPDFVNARPAMAKVA